MSYRVGVDIGGTFTDFCLFDESSGETRTMKVLSRPEAPGAEITEGLKQIRSRYGIEPKDISYFTHGTTVGVNAVIQRKGATLALLVTQNMDDLLEVGRARSSDTLSLFGGRPAPLIPKERVFPIRERLLADGKVDTPLDEETIAGSVKQFAELGVEGVVIAFLHSYRNNIHEKQAEAAVKRLRPDLPVYCSSDIWPVMREYERASTSVVSGYVQPRVSRYLTAFQERLREAGCSAMPLVTKSNGGVMTAEEGKRSCVQMILSGTASGVIGAAHTAAQSVAGHVISLDIGGTSADVALINDGEPRYGIGERVGDFPIFIPSVSVSSVGAGGGSIARVDRGVLRVGPESAGSLPGPVCYDRGGLQPTITDAFLISGLIGQGELGYSAVKLNVAKAREAIARLATELERGVEETAERIIRVAISEMFREVSLLMSSQGVEPSKTTLLACGGAGPMMAGMLAKELKIDSVLIPRTPGVLAAFGGLVADLKSDFIKSVYVDLNAAAMPAIQQGFSELRARAEEWMKAQRFDGETTFTYSADMRYQGQSTEIEIPLSEESILRSDIDLIATAFHRGHESIYGHADPQAAQRVVNLRLVVAGSKPKPSMSSVPRSDDLPQIHAFQDAWVDGQFVRVPFYRRVDLFAGQRIDGPAVITQDDTTTYIPTDMTGETDALGNLLIHRDLAQPTEE